VTRSALTTHYETLRQPAPAPRPTECFRDGWQPPGVTQPDNGLATMGRGQWFLRITREIRKHRMSDDTIQQDDAAMSPASAGSAARVVVLPKPPRNPAFLDPAFASGWFFYSAQAKAALDKAGVRWKVEE
jgi:hypothetical protein